MIRTQISLDRNLYDQARDLAKRRGISFAELCRRSLGEAVGAQQADRPWMAYFGILDGYRDDSGTVDDVVYGRETP